MIQEINFSEMIQEINLNGIIFRPDENGYFRIIDGGQHADDIVTPAIQNSQLYQNLFVCEYYGEI